MTEIQPDEHGHFTIPEAGLYEWRAGKLRKVEPGQRVECGECGTFIIIRPATGTDAALTHDGPRRHTLSPPLRLDVGATVEGGTKVAEVATDLGGFTVTRMFALDEINQDPLSRAMQAP